MSMPRRRGPPRGPCVPAQRRGARETVRASGRCTGCGDSAGRWRGGVRRDEALLVDARRAPRRALEAGARAGHHRGRAAEEVLGRRSVRLGERVELAGEGGAVEQPAPPAHPGGGSSSTCRTTKRVGVLGRKRVERALEDDVLERAVSVDERDTGARLGAEQSARDRRQGGDAAASADEHDQPGRRRRHGRERAGGAEHLEFVAFADVVDDVPRDSSIAHALDGH